MPWSLIINGTEISEINGESELEAERMAQFEAILN